MISTGRRLGGRLLEQVLPTMRGVRQLVATLPAALALASCALALALWMSFTPDGLQFALMLAAAGLLAVYACGQLAPEGLRFLTTYKTIVIMAAVLHIAAFAAIASYIPVSYTSTIGIYYGYGASMAAGQVPLHNFAMEYPPLAAPLFWVPALVAHDIDHYRLVFALEMLGLDLLGAGAALWAIRKFAPRTVPWGIVVAQPLWLIWAGRSIVFERFDLAPAVLVLLAVVLFADDRRRLAWLMLGLATALKLYPIVVVPLFVIMAWGNR